jgi:prolyl 4-hydroxylase
MSGLVLGSQRGDRHRQGYKSAGRSNAVAWVPHDTTPVVWNIVQRLCKLAGVQSTRAESLQVIRYAVGQRYNAHFDAYDKSTTRGQRTTADGGNRMLTMLIYLRAAEEGGGTEFPEAGGVVGQEGPLLVEPR